MVHNINYFNTQYTYAQSTLILLWSSLINFKDMTDGIFFWPSYMSAGFFFIPFHFSPYRYCLCILIHFYFFKTSSFRWLLLNLYFYFEIVLSDFQMQTDVSIWTLQMDFEFLCHEHNWWSSLFFFLSLHLVWFFQ